MRKNTLLKVGTLLFAFTLMTSCFVGGTFAKYVTKGTGSDTARVAKFGVQVTANGETFAKEYVKDDSTEGITANSVISTDKVVAPGTKGNMASMTLAGTPEVAVRVTYNADLALSTNWTVEGGAVYCPIIIKVNGEAINGAEYETLAAFEAAVEAEIKGYTKEYKAGTDLASVKDDSLKVSWEWPFSTGDANDAKDTFLGNQAAADNAATITLTVDTTVTQID